MKDYASMSDAEINSIVANVLFPVNLGIGTPYNHRADAYIYHPNGTYSTKDYCNNPADAWPIIIGQKLSLINADDEWLCVPDYATVDGVAGDDIQKIYFSYGYVDANPLRCAMVVFLMMKEGEND